MLCTSFHEVRLPGAIQDAGHAYGRACRELLAPAARHAYVHPFLRINRTDPEHLTLSAAAWASRLPERYQLQIAAMASGAGVTEAAVREWLYADIAAPRPGGDHHAAIGPPELQSPAQLIGERGPMCTGLVVWQDRRPWTARNCDWYVQTLSRGTAAVFHAVPHRIPCVCVGIMGDIDADTGMNAEGLWMHMHTLLARDEPRAGVSCISWLFWMREALETCASLEDLERFIQRTDRDRGVILFAACSRTGHAAIYECSRSSFKRVDPWSIGGRPALVATNHCRHKHPHDALTDPARVRRHGSTVTRCARVLDILESAHPEECPHDLAEILADEWVEMRDTAMSADLRTIYSAVADPAHRVIHFASGACPAASNGTWREIRCRWD